MKEKSRKDEKIKLSLKIQLKAGVARALHAQLSRQLRCLEPPAQEIKHKTT
jgi:hypothetical protein